MKKASSRWAKVRSVSASRTGTWHGYRTRCTKPAWPKDRQSRSPQSASRIDSCAHEHERPVTDRAENRRGQSELRRRFNGLYEEVTRILFEEDPDQLRNQHG